MSQDAPTAVVIGASIAGLLAAQIFADRNHTVVVVERGRPPDSDDQLRGATAHGYHGHILFLAAQQIIARLLPGWLDALAAHGAVRYQAGSEWEICLPTGVLKPVELADSRRVFQCSRALLEGMLRRHVLADPAIEVRWRHQVDAIDLADDQRPVIHFTRRGRRQEGSLEADFCIDASGRHSHGVEWLEQNGFGPTVCSTTNLDIGYSSGWFRDVHYPSNSPGGLLALPNAPGRDCGGLALCCENGRSVVTLSGFCGNHPPGDIESFRDFATTLGSSSIHQAIEGARLVGRIRRFRKPANRIRHVGDHRRWPAGFVMLGDAVATFNPTFGQGMTVAAQAADAMAAAVDQARPAAEIQRAIAGVYEGVWGLNLIEDLRWPATAAPSVAVRLKQTLHDALLQGAVDDPVLASIWLQITQLERAPAMIFAPQNLARLAWQRLARSAKAPA